MTCLLNRVPTQWDPFADGAVSFAVRASAHRVPAFSGCNIEGGLPKPRLI
jgi:hypothetical protein